MTTLSIFKKYRNYVIDDSGKRIIVQLDLRNKLVRSAYEKIMNELESNAVFETIQKTDKDPTNTWSDFFDVANEILVTKKSKQYV